MSGIIDFYFEYLSLLDFRRKCDDDFFTIVLITIDWLFINSYPAYFKIYSIQTQCVLWIIHRRYGQFSFAKYCFFFPIKGQIKYGMGNVPTSLFGGMIY